MVIQWLCGRVRYLYHKNCTIPNKQPPTDILLLQPRIYQLIVIQSDKLDTKRNLIISM